MLHPNNKQDKNTNPSADRLPTDTPKYTNSQSPAHQREKNSPPPIRTQAQVLSNMKPTQATGPSSPTEGKDQKQEELCPHSLGKGDLKHSKLDKMKRQRNTHADEEASLKTHKTKLTKRK